MNAMSEIKATQTLHAALANARAEFPEIPRRRVATVRMKTGGSYSYDYADLADVFQAVTPALSAHGLSIMQWPNDEGTHVHTALMHASGQSIEKRWPIKAMQGRDLSDAMSFQSAIQVAKRYALTAMLGISTEESHEGDMSRKRGMPENIDANFKSGDGVRFPRGATWDKDKSPRENAEAAAKAIEGQMDDPKTEKGVHGVWDRNKMFLAVFQEKYPDLYENCLDKLQARLNEIAEESTA